MGVSGSGKSTVARAAAERLGWGYVEGDDLHPAANVARMRAGQPLTDADRAPWLDRIAETIAARAPVVVTCSALKRSYRDRLRRDNPGLQFAFLDVPEPVLRDRLARRTGHYMPASLLDSQLATLEPLAPDEPGLTLPGDGEPASAADRIARALHDAG